MQSNNSRTRKPIYILLSILVAVSMWFYVDEFGYNGGSRPTEMTIVDIPISYIGQNGLADRGLMLLGTQTSKSLDLTLEGGRRLVSGLTREDIRVTVNLNEVDRAGLQTVNYSISFTDGRFSRDMVKTQSISSATVNISELNSKVVEVHCELVGNLAEGCSAGQVQLSQETLELRGQAKDIDPVSYVKVTLDIGENAEETISQTLGFQYYDAHDQLLSGENIHPAVETIQATLPVFITKELWLTVDFQEAPGLRKENLDYKISPETITVSGDASMLKGVSAIVLDQMNLLELWESGITSHTYPIIIPEGCQNLSGVTRATVEVGFQDLVSTQVAVDQVQFIDLPDGKDVQLLTEAVMVTIYGRSADVAAVTSEYITITADLSNYAAASGTYTIPVAVDITTLSDVGISGSYQVQISIQEQAETPEEPENAG